MKTTLEIPDELFRTAKAKAAMRGIPFRQIVTEALKEKFDPKSGKSDNSGNPPWMRGFGGLSELHDETVRIDSVIREEFETLEAEDIL